MMREGEHNPENSLIDAKLVSRVIRYFLGFSLILCSHVQPEWLYTKTYTHLCGRTIDTSLKITRDGLPCTHMG